MHSRRLLFLALLLSSPAHAGRVSVPGWFYQELFDLPPKPDAMPLAPWASSRRVTLVPADGGYALEASWEIAGPENGIFDDVLASPHVRIESALLNGKEASIQASDQGTRLTAPIVGRSTLKIRGFIDGDPRQSLAFDLLPAVMGKVSVKTDLQVDLQSDGAIARAAEGFWTGARGLRLQLRDPEPPQQKPPLVTADVALGLTVGDAELSGKARIQWDVRQGSVKEVALQVTDIAADLEVEGEGVADWRREGNRIIIRLDDEKRTSLVAHLRWSSTVPAGEEVQLVLPTLIPENVFHHETSLRLAREDAIEVVPELSGWTPVPASSLVNNDGLIAGTATGAFRLSGRSSGTLNLLRFAPVDQPAAVIDIASTTIAANDEGRLLMRGYFTLRNERAATLRVIPPPGTHLLTVQVQGEPVVPGDDGKGGWLIPLPRSVETVDGLLSFPVEVTALGTGAAWGKRRTESDLALWSVDAPIAVQRVTLHLPPGWRSEGEVGERGIVADFTEGEKLNYGLAVGDTAAATVDAKFGKALSAYMKNDFQAAQQELDALKDMGVETENVRKLQGNLDIVDVDEVTNSATRSDEDSTLARRVKGQARARALEDEIVAKEKLLEAEEAERAGDYLRASEAYEIALQTSDKLAGLDQTEALDLRQARTSASSGYAAVGEKKKAKEDENAPPSPKRSPEKTPTARSASTGEPARIILEPLEVTAHMNKPPVGWAEPEPVLADPVGEDLPAPYDFSNEDIEGELYGTESIVAARGEVALDREVDRAILGGRFQAAMDGKNPGDGEDLLEMPAEIPAQLDAYPVDGDVLAWELRAGASGILGFDEPDGFAYGAGGLGMGGSGMGGSGSGYGSYGGSIGGLAGGVVVSPPKPLVTAAAMTVLVPELGEVVRFQKLLVPAQASPSIYVSASKLKNHRSPQ